MYFYATLEQAAVLLFPIIIGYIIKQRRMVDETFANNIGSIIFSVILPCLIIKSMRYEFTVQTLINTGILLLISTVTLTVLWVIGYFAGKIMDKNFDIRTVIEFSVTCSNFTFMALPIIEILFGNDGVFYASVHNISYFIFSNSISIFLLNRDRLKTRIVPLLFNPPTVAIIAGFAIFAFSIPLPGVINKTVDMLAVCATPLSMLMAGTVLHGVKMKKMFTDWKIYIISAIRLIAAPCLAYYALSMLGFSGFALKIPVIVMAMPVAVQIVVLTKKYDRASMFASQVVAMSTLLSIITIPLIVTLLNL